MCPGASLEIDPASENVWLCSEISFPFYSPPGTASLFRNMHEIRQMKLNAKTIKISGTAHFLSFD